MAHFNGQKNLGELDYVRLLSTAPQMVHDASKLLKCNVGTEYLTLSDVKEMGIIQSPRFPPANSCFDHESIKLC